MLFRNALLFIVLHERKRTGISFFFVTTNWNLRASLSKDTRGVLSVWVPRMIHFFLRNRLPKLPNSSRSLWVSYTVCGPH